MAKYSNTSPYLNTEQTDTHLSIFNPRPITGGADDIQYEIDRIYAYRPDLLAFDLYEDPNLWWVFAQRNPNQLQDPLFDFQTGTTIYLPQLPTLKTVLGI